MRFIPGEVEMLWEFVAEKFNPDSGPRDAFTKLTARDDQELAK